MWLYDPFIYGDIEFTKKIFKKYLYIPNLIYPFSPLFSVPWSVALPDSVNESKSSKNNRGQ